MPGLREPRLRDAYRLHRNENHPLGELPDEAIRKIGAQIIYMLYTGRADMTGDDWGRIFAESIGAEALGSPLGIADVVKGRCAWSLKTVKANRPSETTSVRLISGRCSPDYSYGIENPHDDIQRTGDAVLAIYNSRVQISYRDHSPVRTLVLVRSPDLLNFLVFEKELHEYNLSDYTWTENKQGNFIGKNSEGVHCFTWQPHGSQFTIVEPVPDNAIKFSVRKPPSLSLETALRTMQFDDSWVTIQR